MKTHMTQRTHGIFPVAGGAMAAGLIACGMLAAQPALGAITDDMVFAYTFETGTAPQAVDISGNDNHGTMSIDTATTEPITYSTTSPIASPFTSTRHVQAPAGNLSNPNDYAYINTNTQLTTAIPDMTFSLWYNAQGSTNVARLLSSWAGSGGTGSGMFLFDHTGSGNIRVLTNGKTFAPGATIATDSNWHQLAFVFDGNGTDSATVTFYQDGDVLGTAHTQTITGGAIAAQTLKWFLFEDADAQSGTDNYFANGRYDEAGLWYRALSAEEINEVYTKGLAASIIPEPTSLAALAMASGVLLLRRRRYA